MPRSFVPGAPGSPHALSALLLLSGCALAPSIQPELDRGQLRTACAHLSAHAYYSSQEEQDEHFRQQDVLAHAVARANAVTVAVHALTAAEVEGLLKFAPPASAHYGEQVLLLQVTLDGRKSHVPVDIEGPSLSAGQDGFFWSSPYVDSDENAAARYAMVGAKPPPPSQGGGVGYASAGPSFRDFKALGPFALHGFMLFHMMTGGLLLLSDALAPRGGGGGLYLTRLTRQRDKDTERFAWPPPPVAARSADEAATLLRKMQDSPSVLRGCRALPGEICRVYLPLLREDGKGRDPSAGSFHGEVSFDQEPACKLSVYSEWELPSGPSLVERLNRQEDAGPLLVRGPRPKSVSKKEQP